MLIPIVSVKLQCCQTTDLQNGAFAHESRKDEHIKISSHTDMLGK